MLMSREVSIGEVRIVSQVPTAWFLSNEISRCLATEKGQENAVSSNSILYLRQVPCFLCIFIMTHLTQLVKSSFCVARENN